MKNLSQASRKRFHVDAGVLPRHRADLPATPACSFFSSSAVLIQSVESASASARSISASFAFEVGLALLAALREELARLGLDRIGGLPVAVPQRLRLRARRLGRLLPALLDLVQLARGLLDVVRLRTPSGVSNRYFARSASVCAISSSWTAALAKRFHSSISRSSCSFGAMAASAAFSRSTSVCCSCSGSAGGASMAVRRFAHQAIRLAQREVLGGGANRDALDQLLDALDLLAQRPLGRRAPFFRALTHACVCGGEPLGH